MLELKWSPPSTPIEDGGSPVPVLEGFPATEIAFSTASVPSAAARRSLGSLSPPGSFRLQRSNSHVRGGSLARGGSRANSTVDLLAASYGRKTKKVRTAGGGADLLDVTMLESISTAPTRFWPRSYVCFPGSDPADIEAVACIEPERVMAVHGTLFDEETSLDNRIEPTLGAAVMAERAAKRNRMRNVPVMNRARRIKRSMMFSVLVVHAVLALRIEAARRLAKARNTLKRLLVPIIAKRRFVQLRLRRRYMVKSAMVDSDDLPPRPTPEELSRAVPMLSMLAKYPGVLQALANEMDCLAFDQAEHIIRQGESSSNLYFVVRGNCVERAVVRNARKATPASGGGAFSTLVGANPNASPTQGWAERQHQGTPSTSASRSQGLSQQQAPPRAYDVQSGRRSSIVAVQTVGFKKVRGSHGRHSLTESIDATHSGPPTRRSSTRSPSTSPSTPTTTSAPSPVKSYPIPSDNRLLLYGDESGLDGATSGAALIQSSTSVFSGYSPATQLQPADRARNAMQNMLGSGALKTTSTGNMLSALATVGRALGKFLHNRTTQIYEGARYGPGSVFGSVLGIPVAHSCSIVVTSGEACCWMLSHESFQRVIFGAGASSGGLVAGFCREVSSAENNPSKSTLDVHARLGVLQAARNAVSLSTSPHSPARASLDSVQSPPLSSLPPQPRQGTTSLTAKRLSQQQRASTTTISSQQIPDDIFVPQAAIEELREAYLRQCIATIPLSFPVHLSLTTMKKVPYWNELSSPSQLLFHLNNPPPPPAEGQQQVSQPHQQIELVRGSVVRPDTQSGDLGGGASRLSAYHNSVSGGRWLSGLHLGKLTPVVFERGDALYRAGTHCPVVYLLLAGEVTLQQEDVPWRGFILGEDESPLLGGAADVASGDVSPGGRRGGTGRSASPRHAHSDVGVGRRLPAPLTEPHPSRSTARGRSSTLAVGSLLRLSRTKSFVWLGHQAAILPEVPTHSCIATSDIVKVYAIDRLHFLDTLVDEPGLLCRVRNQMLEARAAKLLFRSLHWFNYVPLMAHIPYWARAEHVAKGIRPRVIAPGTVIVNQFDTVKCIYLVASGSVRILPRALSSTRVLNEPPIATWHGPLTEASSSSFTSHNQRRRVTAFQDDDDLSLLLPLSTHVLPDVSGLEEGTPSTPSTNKVSEQRPQTGPAAGDGSAPIATLPQLGITKLDLDDPSLHLQLPPSSRLLRPRLPVGGSPQCTSLLQMAAATAQGVQARDSSASPPHKGNRGLPHGRPAHRSPPVITDSPSSVLWPSDPESHAVVGRLSTDRSDDSPSREGRRATATLFFEGSPLNGSATNDAPPSEPGRIHPRSRAGSLSGPSPLRGGPTVGETQYPVSIVSYLNPRQQQQLSQLLREEEAMAVLAAKAIPPVRYVLGGTWECLVADKWADTYEAASVVELWEVPIEGIRNAFDRNTCVAKVAMLETARRHQMAAVGLDAPLTTPLPPLLASQRLLSKGALPSSAASWTGVSRGTSAVRTTSADKVSTVQPAEGGGVSSSRRDATPMKRGIPDEEPKIGFDLVARPPTVLNCETEDVGVTGVKDSVPPPPHVPHSPSLSLVQPAPEGAADIGRGAAPSRGPRPPPSHSMTSFPARTAGLSPSASVRSPHQESIRVRRGSVLDEVLCDNIEEFLDPQKPRSINSASGHVISVNVEDTTVCGGGATTRTTSSPFQRQHDDYAASNYQAASPRPQQHRPWWSDAEGVRKSANPNKLRDEDIEVEVSLKRNGLLNPTAMLKRLQEERAAEAKAEQDVKRAALVAMQQDLVARTREISMRRKKGSKHAEELARKRLEVTLDIALEQRRLAWDERKREERILAGTKKEPLQTTTSPRRRSSPEGVASAPLLPTLLPHSPKRVRGVLRNSEPVIYQPSRDGPHSASSVTASAALPLGLQGALMPPHASTARGSHTYDASPVSSNRLRIGSQHPPTHRGSLRKGVSPSFLHRAQPPSIPSLGVDFSTSHRHTGPSAAPSPRGGLSSMGVRLPLRPQTSSEAHSKDGD